MSDVVLMAELISGLTASLGFVWIYATQSPWRSTPVGKSIMLLVGSLLLLVVFGLINALVGDYPGKEVLRFGIYTLVNIALWRQLIVLLKVQNKRYRDEQLARRPEVEDNSPTV